MMKDFNFSLARRISYIILGLGFLTAIIISFYGLIFSEISLDILVVITYILFIGVPVVMFFTIKNLHAVYKLDTMNNMLLVSNFVISLVIYIFSTVLLIYATLSDETRFMAAMSTVMGSMFLFNAIELILKKNNHQIEKKS